MAYEEMVFKTGDIILVDFSNGIGHQQKGIRPALIVSNNIGNTFSPVLEVLPITTKRTNSKMPTHVNIEPTAENGLRAYSTIEAEGKIPVNKFQVKKHLGKISDPDLERVAFAMVYATPIILQAFNNGVQDTENFKKVSKI